MAAENLSKVNNHLKCLCNFFYELLIQEDK